MKKKAIALILTSIMALTALTGCGKSETEDTTEYENGYATPDDFEPAYYLSEDELPEDAYYIVHTETVTEIDKNGKESEVEVTKYYPLLQAENTGFETYDAANGYDPTRITWVNYNIDEGLIPTMYAGDKMIYKSSTYIPTTYSLEKFFDEGYTIGVCGLEADLSGNYKYVSATNSDGTGYVMSTSDAIGFDGLEADSIYLVAVGDDKVSALNTSLSGTVKGLDLMQVYSCDIRTGTEKIAADLTCNIHYFSSAENYMFGSFTFITDVIAQINIPYYASTGYYNIGGGGFFRYLGDREGLSDYHDLKTSDYNATIYTYNEENTVCGTTLGLVFDDNDFLIASNDINEDGEVVGQDTSRTYDDVVSDSTGESNISNVTSLKLNDNGYYDGTYTVTSLSDPLISGKNLVYTMKVMNSTTGEVLDFKYTYKSKGTKPEVGHQYAVCFTEAGSSFDGYEVISLDDAGETDTAK